MMAVLFYLQSMYNVLFHRNKEEAISLSQFPKLPFWPALCSKEALLASPQSCIHTGSPAVCSLSGSFLLLTHVAPPVNAPDCIFSHSKGKTSYSP